MNRIESYSSLATLASCCAKYAYAYVERLDVPGVDIPQHLGSALHAAFKVLYRGGWGGAARLPAARDALRAEWKGFKPPLGYKKPWVTEGYALARLETYVADREKVPTTLETSEVIAEFTEETHVFDWSDVQGRLVRVRAVPDFVIRVNDKTYVVDHKTTTSGKYGINDFFPESARLTLDVLEENAAQDKALEYSLGHQLRTYAATVQNLTGVRVDGGLINAVWCGELANKAWVDKKGAPRKSARDLIRIVSFTQEQIEMAHEWVRGNLVVRDACAAAETWPKNEHACGAFGGCEFIPLCLAPSPGARRARMLTQFTRRPDGK